MARLPATWIPGPVNGEKWEEEYSSCRPILLLYWLGN